MFINYAQCADKILVQNKLQFQKSISTNYDFCKYLVDELEPLVDSSIVESAELKLCLNCAIKKKEFLFNSIRQLQDSIYKKSKE
ncbi:41390_t:CDS:2, partial [Gigaspora margarita]